MRDKLIRNEGNPGQMMKDEDKEDIKEVQESLRKKKSSQVKQDMSPEKNEYAPAANSKGGAGASSPMPPQLIEEESKEV